MTSVGEALVEQLRDRGVEVVFGIPGVHTVELYRGLASSGIRHVTPRHEQGAGFMADGYARVSGKPGVAFVITGPGLTNALTPMAQARADSVPMLVVSGVNAQASLGRGMGHLHELPDQQAVAAAVALVSEHVAQGADLGPALDRAFRPFTEGRPGPTHIQVPLDVAGQPCESGADTPEAATVPLPTAELDRAAEMLAAATCPVILAGGGARFAPDALRQLAERLDAPVVQTTNARGLMHDHALGVPASPSLAAVRALIDAADVVLAVGTEMGPTDYDMYASGTMPDSARLIRMDCCPQQIGRHPHELGLVGDAATLLPELATRLSGPSAPRDGARRAAETRAAAWGEIGPEYRALTDLLSAVRDAAPDALLVGDSTQAIYAGNLYYDHDRPGGWFNAATGYGALGYAIPAAIGAAIADPGARVICIAGDGGAQFSLPEVMAAVDENLPITFLIWNNHGYREIATSMEAVDVAVVGCDPTPPDFEATARSFGIAYRRCDAMPEALGRCIAETAGEIGPNMIEIQAPAFTPRK